MTYHSGALVDGTILVTNKRQMTHIDRRSIRHCFQRAPPDDHEKQTELAW